MKVSYLDIEASRSLDQHLERFFKDTPAEFNRGCSEAIPVLSSNNLEFGQYYNAQEPEVRAHITDHFFPDDTLVDKLIGRFICRPSRSVRQQYPIVSDVMFMERSADALLTLESHNNLRLMIKEWRCEGDLAIGADTFTFDGRPRILAGLSYGHYQSNAATMLRPSHAGFEYGPRTGILLSDIKSITSNELPKGSAGLDLPESYLVLSSLFEAALQR